MRLKRIKLAGFKSFVDVTNADFKEQMTCIVGPNGCGKSNIIDAVRWVLGESSAKNLRGDDMTDVIFNGTNTRNKVGQATVELIFTNDDGKQHNQLADRSEISIKRTVTRQKISTYFLNGTKCRKKDVTDIFLGTGMGARSYSIIEQGTISKLIDAKPQELRVFLEEAAGVSKFKERRKEAESRIRSTRANLERLRDVKHELIKQVDKLEKQAKNAIRYKDLKAVERHLKAVIKTQDADELQEQIDKKSVLLNQAKTATASIEAIRAKTDRELIESETKKMELERSEGPIHQANMEISKQEAKIEQKIVSLKQAINLNDEKIRKANESLESLSSELRKLTEEQTTLNTAEKEELANINSMTATKVELTESTASMEDELSRLTDEWESAMEKVASNTQSGAKEATKIALAESEIKQIESRLNQIQEVDISQEIEIINQTIEDLEYELEDSLTEQLMSDDELNTISGEHQQAVKQLECLKETEQEIEKQKIRLETKITALKQFSKGNGEESSNHVFKQIQCAPEWELAIEMALKLLKNPELLEGNTLPASTENTVMLKGENDKTENTLAKTVTKGYFPSIFNHIYLAPNHGEIHATKEGTITIGNLLIGSADIENSSTKIKQQMEAENKTLTDTNEVLEANKDQIEIKADEIETLQLQANKIKQNNETIKNKIVEIKQTLSLKAQAKSQLEDTEKRNAEEIISLKEKQKYAQEIINAPVATSIKMETIDTEAIKIKRGEIRDSLNTYKTRLEAERTALEASQRALNSIQADITTNTKQTIYVDSKMKEIKLNIEQNETEALSEELLELSIEHQEILESARKANLNVEAYRKAISELDEEARNLRANVFATINEIKKASDHEQYINLEIEKLKVRLIELDANDLINRQKIKESAEYKNPKSNNISALTATTASIHRIGAVNLTAVEDYEQHKERLDFLTQQNDDLIKSLNTLEEAIETIDKETREMFKKTFDQVNEGLQKLFPKVFGGGSAYLELTGENLLDTGVTIMARPPGKKNSTIQLLSGGEKALTALALVFSIFELNPAPFCMLDEVDAPLDDVNVQRYCKLVSEMSETIQFIYISHNKIAMEMADVLAGVTMHEAGVSRLVSVDMSTAEKLIDA